MLQQDKQPISTQITVDFGPARAADSCWVEAASGLPEVYERSMRGLAPDRMQRRFFESLLTPLRSRGARCDRSPILLHFTPAAHIPAGGEVSSRQRAHDP
jgi:hypothetical protein